MLITPSFEKSLIVEQFQGNYLKARQDVKFYNQGKVQLGKTNISRDIAVQPYFYFTFLTQALNCLRSTQYCFKFFDSNLTNMKKTWEGINSIPAHKSITPIKDPLDSYQYS